MEETQREGRGSWAAMAETTGLVLAEIGLTGQDGCLVLCRKRLLVVTDWAALNSTVPFSHHSAPPGNRATCSAGRLILLIRIPPRFPKWHHLARANVGKVVNYVRFCSGWLVVGCSSSSSSSSLLFLPPKGDPACVTTAQPRPLRATLPIIVPSH